MHDTVQYLKSRVDEVIFDAEHFFDGAAEDEDYVLKVLEAASQAGADFMVLCDTNGGSMPREVSRLTKLVTERFQSKVGIHTHNDAGWRRQLLGGGSGWSHHGSGYRQRIRRTLWKCQFGYRDSQSATKDGLWMRAESRLSRLTQVSRTVDEITNYVPQPQQPYVGRRAFSHKGGVHINAVMKDPSTYEHVQPHHVGNRRRILASDLSGFSTIIFKAREFGVELDPNDLWTVVLERIKSLEYDGYQFEGAEASLLLMMHEARGTRENILSLVKRRSRPPWTAWVKVSKNQEFHGQPHGKSGG